MEIAINIVASENLNIKIKYIGLDLVEVLVRCRKEIFFKKSDLDQKREYS